MITTWHSEVLKLTIFCPEKWFCVKNIRAQAGQYFVQLWQNFVKFVCCCDKILARSARKRISIAATCAGICSLRSAHTYTPKAKKLAFHTISALLLCVFVSFEWDLCCTTSNCRKSDNLLMYQAHSGTTFDFPWWQTSNTLPYFSLATYSVEIQFSTVSLFQLLYFEESSEILGFPALPHRPTVAPS